MTESGRVFCPPIKIILSLLPLPNFKNLVKSPAKIKSIPWKPNTSIKITPADPPPFMIAQGYSRKNPYYTGVVELEEGARVDARIEGVDVAKPEEIKVGMPLKVKFLNRGDGAKQETYLAFEPE